VAAPAVPDRVEVLERRIQELQNALIQRGAQPPTVAPRETPAVPPYVPRYKPSQADLNALVEGGDKAVEVFSKLQASMMEDFAGITVPFVQAQLAEHVAPLRQAIAVAEAQRHTEAFTVAFPDLKDWTDVARAEANALFANPPRQFTEWPEVYEEVAKRTRAKKEQYEKRIGVKPTTPPPRPADGTKPRPTPKGELTEADIMRDVVGE